MAGVHGSLRDAFVEDHRHLTRGLTNLIAAVEGNDVASAMRIADELDRAVGPHIEFEERVFYPELARILGRDFVHRLYHEHAEGREAVRALVGHPSDTPIPGAMRRKLLGQLETALEHALSCGSLLSHVEALGQEREAALLARLQSIRATGTRWTALGGHRDPAEGASRAQ